MKSQYNPSFNPNAQTPTAPPPYELTRTPSLETILQHVPKELHEDFTALRQEIKNAGLANHEARVCLILDISGSMQDPNQYFNHPEKGNQIQRLINKALTLAFLFDDNHQVEVFPLGDKAYPFITIDKNNFTKATELVLTATNGFTEYTNYADPVSEVRKHYFADNSKVNTPQLCSDAPVFALFITDGEPNLKKTEAMSQFKSASHQAIFFKFLALEGKHKSTFEFLNGLDKAAVKKDEKDDAFYTDNCHLAVLAEPEKLDMQTLIKQYRGWVTEAHKRGLLSHDAGLTKNIDVKSEGRVTSTQSTLFNEPKPVSQNAATPPQVPQACCTIL
jgi:hypothetical protein